MKSFALVDFITHLAKIELATTLLSESILEAGAQTIEERAKEKIGAYQEAAGPFGAWSELADSTKKDRLAQGYTENDPLLRSGSLRDSIEHEVSGDEAIVGSKSDTALYQEVGTDKIPPRSFLGGAAFEEAKNIEKLAGRKIFSALIGENIKSLPVNS
jgi:phage gpG-like protein